MALARQRRCGFFLQRCRCLPDCLILEGGDSQCMRRETGLFKSKDLLLGIFSEGIF
jgi:hypothetical protein